MKESNVQLNSKEAKGYEVSLGPVNLVMVVTDVGLIGCGALDILGLDKFNIPAARVSGVSTVDDVLAAELNLVNGAATEKGILPGMTGREALELL